jgi:transcription elongation factor GreA
MSDQQQLPPSFAEAIEREEWDSIEELWLEYLDVDPIPTRQLLEVRRQLWKAGEKSLAMTLLELLAETLEARQSDGEVILALRELVRLGDPPAPETIERLQRALVNERSDSPSLRTVVDRFRLTEARRPLETLDTMTLWLDHDRGTVVEVIGQGVGRVTDINLELETIKVDTGSGRPLSVPFGAISKFLRRLPEGDFRRRAVEDPDGLSEQVLSSPGDALVELLESFGEPAEVAAIKSVLEGFVPSEGWTAWWGKARNHPRVLTSGSGSRLRYSVSHSAESATDLLLEELRAAEPRSRITIARRLIGRDAEAATEAASFLMESLPELEGSDPGLAWETAGVIAGVAGFGEAALEFRNQLITESSPLQLLSGIQDRVARVQALQDLRAAHGEDWPEIWAEWFLHEQTAGTLAAIVAELDAAGESENLDASLEAVFRSHNEHPAQFVFACESMTEDDCPEAILRRMTPSLLEKLTDTLTRSEFGPFRARAKSLLDGGHVAVRLILESASEQQADRFISRVGRISAVEPQRIRVLEQAARQAKGTTRTEHVIAFVATATAVEAKRAELKQLLDVEIPKTLKGIQAAAAEGDLRENFEYHMLRDRQELQSARAAALQRDLGRVQILEPGAADTSRINVGTVVRFNGEDDTPIEAITILGSWDADVDRRVYANGSGFAQKLLGRSIGDQVEVDGKTATIREIVAWPAD